jgi:hypothetical protein
MVAKARMVGIEQRQARSLVEVGVGHHLADIRLGQPLFRTLDPGGNALPLPWLTFALPVNQLAKMTPFAAWISGSEPTELIIDSVHSMTLVSELPWRSMRAC